MTSERTLLYACVENLAEGIFSTLENACVEDPSALVPLVLAHAVQWRQSPGFDADQAKAAAAIAELLDKARTEYSDIDGRVSGGFTDQHRVAIDREAICEGIAEMLLNALTLGREAGLELRVSSTVVAAGYVTRRAGLRVVPARKLRSAA